MTSNDVTIAGNLIVFEKLFQVNIKNPKHHINGLLAAVHWEPAEINKHVTDLPCQPISFICLSLSYLLSLYWGQQSYQQQHKANLQRLFCYLLTVLSEHRPIILLYYLLVT